MQSETRDNDVRDVQLEIAELAYSIWEQSGREDGHDVEHWVLAEQEVLRRRSAGREDAVQTLHQAA
jgi:hypothetical protein